MDIEMKKTTIQANLQALEKLLHDANVRASEAVAAINQGEINQAIGTSLGIEDMLKQATALYGAAIAIQRA
jgi:hypothetical protein